MNDYEVNDLLIFTHNLLLTVGKAKDNNINDDRKLLLMHGLLSSLPQIRYATITAISLTNDNSFLPMVKQALDSETETMLRSNLSHLIDKLESL